MIKNQMKNKHFELQKKLFFSGMYAKIPLIFTLKVSPIPSFTQAVGKYV